MNPEVFKGLKNEKNALLEELKSIEQLLMQEKEVRSKIFAIDNLLSEYGRRNTPTTDKNENEINLNGAGYNPNLSWEEKVLFSLKIMGTGFSSEVAEKILEFEPKLNKEKIKQSTKVYLSKMLKDKRIAKVGQVGRKFKFGYIK